MSFAFPAVLFALVALPAIWWLLRLTPPRPKPETFPPTRLLLEITRKEETPSQTPWWLIALRLILAALLIVALAGPVLRPTAEEAPGTGPLLLVVDNGWASADRIDAMKATASAILRLADDTDRAVAFVATAAPAGQIMAPTSPADIEARLGTLEPEPFPVDRASLLPALRTIASTAGFGGVVWLTDGLGGTEAEAFSAFLTEISDGPIVVYTDPAAALIGLLPPTSTADALTVPLLRQDMAAPFSGAVVARDLRGRPIAEARVSFEVGVATAIATFDLPTELRNEIVRLEIVGENSAGAVQLLDERYRRRTVGVITGAPSDQPLLSADYYITRALLPFADIRTTAPELPVAIAALIDAGVSAIILADVGTLPAESDAALAAWVQAGGTLIRFAGPRLASSAPTLIPVRLRQGGRTLGGALSWETPQPLGPYPRTSPFYGLDVPEDVLVQRQVLAEPDATLLERTWAALADGTPLVTGGPSGDGLLVLFHVTADPAWSNLPLSGIFVEMLRRIVSMASASTSNADAAATAALSPFRVLDGYGRSVDPGAAAEPIPAGEPDIAIDRTHPPGLYGNEDGFRALSLLGPGATLPPFDVGSVDGVSVRAYPESAPFELRPWLLAAALAVFLLDALAVLWLAGAFAGRRHQTAALMLLAGALAFPGAHDARAQALTPADQIAMAAANQTSLAYVVTGVAQNDDLSRAGLRGLSIVLAQRTSFVPGEPVGVNLATDELAFFPIIYWRVDPAAPLPTPEAIARLDAYMRNGGVVLFDTADQIERTAQVLGGVTPAGQLLREMMATLDLPPMQPVTAEHVLTKTFYLLSEFPGRLVGGPLWAEAPETTIDPLTGNAIARTTDGVSPILVTSNDFAGAWAVDERGAFLLPTGGGDSMQREYAFRVGINIVMYTLTGNYKTDQVHIPALLERLGQ